MLETEQGGSRRRPDVASLLAQAGRRYSGQRNSGGRSSRIERTRSSPDGCTFRLDRQCGPWQPRIPGRSGLVSSGSYIKTIAWLADIEHSHAPKGTHKNARRRASDPRDGPRGDSQGKTAKPTPRPHMRRVRNSCGVLICRELVTADQTEMETEFRRHGQPGSDRHLLHVRCLAAWEFERTKIDVVTGERR